MSPLAVIVMAIYYVGSIGIPAVLMAAIICHLPRDRR